VQYAREQVPQQFWSSPAFIRTNRRVTAVWAVAFDGGGGRAAGNVPAVPLWLNIVASIMALLGAAWFTRWYPRVGRRADEAARRSTA
jgi:hypothetical protein